ncbi:MAG: sigma-70 family RNA polymerase sigma factor [Sarcina sp.]
MKTNIEFLLKQAKLGDKKAITIIIEKYERLIHKKANSFFIKNYDYEDLLQIGRLTMLKAIEQYDMEKAYNFTAYLDRAITNNFLVIIRSVGKTNNEISLDYKTENDGNIYDTLGSEIIIEKIIEEKFIKEKLREALNTLDKEELLLIKELYIDKKTIKEVASIKNQKYTMIRGKREKILLKLKSFFVQNKLII